jgi:hypothetical protein
MAAFAQPMTWFGIAVVGMVIVFVGLGVDAWRHNNGAEEETLLSLGNPGHLIAGIGLLVTALATLFGFSVSALHGVDTARDAIRRFVPVTAAWAIVAAVGICTYTTTARSRRSSSGTPSSTKSCYRYSRKAP